MVAIKPLKVVAFTASFVTFIHDGSSWGGGICERRERRDDIFPSFDEAKAEAVKRASAEVEGCKEELQRLRSALGQWESLKETK